MIQKPSHFTPPPPEHANHQQTNFTVIRNESGCQYRGGYRGICFIYIYMTYCIANIINIAVRFARNQHPSRQYEIRKKNKRSLQKSNNAFCSSIKS